jgi:hypothetical protein
MIEHGIVGVAILFNFGFCPSHVVLLPGKVERATVDEF